MGLNSFEFVFELCTQWDVFELSFQFPIRILEHFLWNYFANLQASKFDMICEEKNYFFKWGKNGSFVSFIMKIMLFFSYDFF